MPIFFHGLSTRFLGLLACMLGSLEGGVVGGVIGSPVLDCTLPESSVKPADPESPLVVLEVWPDGRWDDLPRDVTSLREKLERDRWLDGGLEETGDPNSRDVRGERRPPFDLTRLTACSSRLGLETIVSPSSWENSGSERGKTCADDEWAFRKGMKIDSSIKSWTSFTAASSIEGGGGTDALACWTISSRTSLETLISRGEPGRMYAANSRCHSIRKWRLSGQSAAIGN
jgi:hypothetical protein